MCLKVRGSLELNSVHWLHFHFHDSKNYTVMFHLSHFEALAAHFCTLPYPTFTHLVNMVQYNIIISLGMFFIVIFKNLNFTFI